MSVFSKAVSKIAKVAQPITKATAKVMAKIDANKPELMLYSGLTMVIIGTGWAIYSTTKVDSVIEESKREKDELDAKKAEMTDKEFRKAFSKVRIETIWKFIKLYGAPALIWLLGLTDMVGGHFVLKKRYILTTMTLKGMEEFIQFVKGNVIEDVGESKWEEYAHGVVGKETISIEEKQPDGTLIKKTKDVPICRDHDNPWRIPYNEKLFKSYKPNAESNFFFLQAGEKYWNEERYQKDKDAEISMYEILDWLGADWSQFDKNYRTWLRNQVWGHHIHGDDYISWGLHLPINDPARRRQSDVIYMEFNPDGEPRDIINRYRDEAWLKSQRKNGRKQL